MFLKNSVLPQANIYSSKILFDKFEDRNQKRMAQIVRRKNALLSKNKNNKITKDSEQMITPSTQEISNFTNNNIILNLSKSSIKECNKLISSKKPRTMERFLSSSFKYQNNNNSTNKNNNFKIVDEDLSEKEVNISNLNDNDSYFENFKEKGKSQNNSKFIIVNNKNNNQNNNLSNLNNSNNNDKKAKEKNNMYQRNKYAIEFLSSSLDSFVEFKNKLVTKAKYNKNYFTSSYSQALFLEFNNLCNKKYGNEKKYEYDVNDIIKEENESYSPKQNNKLQEGQTSAILCSKKKNNLKNSVKFAMNKAPNKSFCKTYDNFTGNKKDFREYSLNKNVFINNYKLKIPKTKLSLEIKNKRKTFENKEYKNEIDIDKKKNQLSPKFIKMKLFSDDINKRESNKNSTKEKSKKIKKKVKINISQNVKI